LNEIFSPSDVAKPKEWQRRERATANPETRGPDYGVGSG
jgi:hypothetical protein